MVDVDANVDAKPWSMDNGVSVRVETTESMVKWEFVTDTHRGKDIDSDLTRWMNARGAEGYGLVHMYATATSDSYGNQTVRHHVIMGRKIGGAELLKQMAEKERKLRAESDTLLIAQRNIANDRASLEAKERELAEREARLEKIRQGMVEDDSLRLDPRAKEMLEKMKEGKAINELGASDSVVQDMAEIAEKVQTMQERMKALMFISTRI